MGSSGSYGEPIADAGIVSISEEPCRFSWYHETMEKLMGWALHSQRVWKNWDTGGLLGEPRGTEAVMYRVCIYKTTAFFLSGVGGTVSQNL